MCICMYILTVSKLKKNEEKISSSMLVQIFCLIAYVRNLCLFEYFFDPYHTIIFRGLKRKNGHSPIMHPRLPKDPSYPKKTK